MLAAPGVCLSHPHPVGSPSASASTQDWRRGGGAGRGPFDKAAAGLSESTGPCSSTGGKRPTSAVTQHEQQKQNLNTHGGSSLFSGKNSGTPNSHSSRASLQGLSWDQGGQRTVTSTLRSVHVQSHSVLCKRTHLPTSATVRGWVSRGVTLSPSGPHSLQAPGDLLLPLPSSPCPIAMLPHIPASWPSHNSQHPPGFPEESHRSAIMRCLALGCLLLIQHTFLVIYSVPGVILRLMKPGR